jgi:hypothetical protein
LARGVISKKSYGGCETGLNVTVVDIPITGILFYINSALNDSFASESTFQVLSFSAILTCSWITFPVMD